MTEEEQELLNSYASEDIHLLANAATKFQRLVVL